MNIGFAPIFPYRGSIHNMVYISRLFEELGHSAYWLKCGGGLQKCYNLLLKSNPKFVECSKCIVGGIHSFDVNNIFTINSDIEGTLDTIALDDIVGSTAYSLHRVETLEECSSEEVVKTKKSLYSSANTVYQNTLKWIADFELELIFVYNGRLDMTQAVLAACKAANVPFITVEAAYPGVALEVNDDCRSTKSLYKITEDFIDKPMTEYQSLFAGKIAAQMLLKRNLIWRLYNTNSFSSSWPVKGFHKKILIAPSSSHEFIGVQAWTPAWQHMTEGIDAIVEKAGFRFEDCVLRCHPNWSENIGSSQDGMRAERYYKNWADKRGVAFIPSSSNVSTNDLTAQSDVVIVQYGTVGIEAALMGKRVINLWPSFYSKAGFSIQIHSVHDLTNISALSSHDSVDTMRKVLRFLYIYHKRFCQFTDFISPQSVFENIYYSGAPVERLLASLECNYLLPDDDKYADNLNAEDMVLGMMSRGEYDRLATWHEPQSSAGVIPINRKFAFRWLDLVRRRMPAGDR